MDFPRRGCLVKPDGSVVSSWEWVHPGTLTQPVLLVEDPDGNRTRGYSPEDVVIDLESVTEPGEMYLFYREQHELRARKAEDGQWHFVRVLGDRELPSAFGVLMESRRKR